MEDRRGFRDKILLATFPNSLVTIPALIAHSSYSIKTSRASRLVVVGDKGSSLNLSCCLLVLITHLTITL